MNSDNKNTVQEAGRWLRVSLLTLSVLSPVINTVASRMRERAEVLRKEAEKHGGTTYSQSQERLLTVGASVADALSDLKDHPYSKEVLKQNSNLADRGSNLSQTIIERGGQVGRDLAERGSKVARTVVERGSQIAQDVAGQGEKVSKELMGRGNKVSKEVAKRGKKATKELNKQAQQAQRELAKQGKRVNQKQSNQANTFWTVFGFSTGLTAALLGGYLLLRKRIQQNEKDNQQVQISQNGYLNDSSNSTRTGEIRSISQSAPVSKPETSTPTTTVAEPITEPVTEQVVKPQPMESQAGAPTDTPSTQSASAQATASSLPTVENSSTKGETPTVTDPLVGEKEEQNIPAATATDSSFLGVVSTKLYYPIETPLSQLSSPEDGALDVVYFGSENEARSQGFSPAQ